MLFLESPPPHIDGTDYRFKERLIYENESLPRMTSEANKFGVNY